MNLSLTGATQTLNEQFLTGFKFRSGGVNPDPLQPLTPGIPWNMGFMWPHQPPKDKPITPSYLKPFPAFSDMGGGTSDVAPNADMVERIGQEHSPFKIYNGMLVMRALPMPAHVRPLVHPKLGIADYISHAMISYPYCQTYGVFAMTAQLPKDKGLWPAFWMLPADLGWPPEIDIMEVLGKDTATLYSTVHAREMKGGKTGLTHKPGFDLSAGYHEYAVDWGPESLRFYLDRKLINSVPTPASLKGRPCYLIANLAVGNTNTWPGPVAPKDYWLSEMRVKNIRAWQRPEYAT